MASTAPLRPTVLLAEDHDDTRLSYELLLQLYGVRVQNAASGPAVLDSLRASAPDLLVLDMGLPEMDGWETARRIRSDERVRDLPIIAVTGHVFPQDRDRARELRCDAFLAKPCPPQEIVREVARLLADRWTAQIDAAGEAFRLQRDRHQALRERALKLSHQLRVSLDDLENTRETIASTMAELKRLLR